jgi:tetratricopeptide (TPR) repeat protein
VPEVDLNRLDDPRPTAARRHRAALGVGVFSPKIGAPNLGGPDNLLSGWPKATGGDLQASLDPWVKEFFSDLLRAARARTTSCPGHRSTCAWLFIFCLGFCSQAIVRADSAPVALATPQPPAASPVAHLTDEQDRLMDGHLSPAAENRSQANALYAEALLLPEGVADGQQKALDLFRQIVALDPAFTDAQVRLANSLLQAGQLDQAFAQLQSAASAHPDSIPIEVALGFTQRLRGHNEEAVRLCTDALTRDSTQSVAMRVLLEIASEQDDLAGAVVHIEDILKAGADVPASSWLNLAQLYQEVARSETNPPDGNVMLKTRLPILQQAAAKPPSSVETLTLLADTYRDLGRKLDGLKTLQKASALEPSDVDLVLRCADLEADLNQTAAALRDYENAYALNPSLPGLREMLGGLYLDDQRYEDAVRLFAEALADSPQDAGLEIDLGLAYEEAHHPEKAQPCFERVFASNDCPQEAYLKLAFFQLAHDEIKEAGQTLASAQAHFPKSARIRYYEAIQERYAKNYDAAVASLAQVRALAVGAEADVLDPAYYLESSLTLTLAGQMDRLEPVLQEGLSKYPDDPSLMNELAYFWAEQDRHLPEALALSRRAAALEPDNGPILDTWGWVYFQMGQVKDALPYLQRAAVMTNNDPVVLQHVGDAYLKLGLRREAIATWSRALEKDPHNSDLANRIDAALAQAKNAHPRSAPNP